MAVGTDAALRLGRLLLLYLERRQVDGKGQRYLLTTSQDNVEPGRRTKTSVPTQHRLN